MSIFRTIALFVYLFGYMIVHYSVLCKAERALAAGDTETVRQLVKKHIPHWSKGILNVTGVTRESRCNSRKSTFNTTNDFAFKFNSFSCF